jgi:hypothetical protein
MRYWGYRAIKFSSVIVGEGAIVWDYRGIGRIGVTCRVDIIDYSVSG